MLKNILHPQHKLEIWGGLECSINRLKSGYIDQLQLTGHYKREDDIQLFADLGIKALRYPILWEKHQPFENISINWKWAMQQLSNIKKYNINPIVGLIHHGSGPLFTSLLDNTFPYRLALYAKKVALKFPWITCYTPVNEPLTTARFSGLYGLWYPHHRDDKSFYTALLNQLKSTVLSMRAIRDINSEALLIQTEDLAKTYSTHLLQDQADYENDRRWLTIDILCGKLNHHHPLWNFFIRAGISEYDLMFFQENPCPPNIIGANYYITSERYLDEKFWEYPTFTHGGNSFYKYADVEAARVNIPEQTGIMVLLKELWQRFNIPIAITEAHLNCSREEQLRWFKEIWDICNILKNEDINIKAVTAWSLLGGFGWNKLLTSKSGEYETGVFDVRSGQPRPTAMVDLIKSLSRNEDYNHPLILEKGWWHQPERFYHFKQIKSNINIIKKNKTLLIIGKTGALGYAFSHICSMRNITHVALTRRELNITQPVEIEKIIEQYKPWAIINASGYVKVDQAETEAEECFAINAKGPASLAEVCKKYGIRFMTFSSDLVFNGEKLFPYIENDNVQPLNVYGKSKAEGEKMVLAANPNALIIRTSSFFGPWDKHNFAHYIIKELTEDKAFTVAKDITFSPTYIPDLVNTALDIFIDREQGICHLSNQGKLTWAEFADEIATRHKCSKNKIVKKLACEMHWTAKRPVYSVLENSKGIMLPPLYSAIERYLNEKKT